MLQKFNPENENIMIHVNGKLYNRNEAKISVFDSVVQGGDAVWEGLRVYQHGIFCLEEHLNRLIHSAHALDFKGVPNLDEIKTAIFDTLNANNMSDGVHIRLTLTRGEKITSGMDPRLNQTGCGLIVLAEWKAPVYDNEHGLTVHTAHIQRNSPRHLDSKIHHNNLLNNILAKIQANMAGKDAALMLDAYGFVAELNGTNVFMVKDDKIFTPHADACLHGITRSMVIKIAHENNIPCIEKNISLTEFYNADEVFCTGTMGELTPIIEIDGRKIINRSGTTIMNQLRSYFQAMIPLYSTPIV